MACEFVLANSLNNVQKEAIYRQSEMMLTLDSLGFTFIGDNGGRPTFAGNAHVSLQRKAQKPLRYGDTAKIQDLN